MYRLVCLTLFVSGALGQISKPGICDYTAIGGFVSDLNFTEMFGTWNQIARIGNPTEVGDCSSMTLSGNYLNGTLVGVDVSYLEVINKTKTYHNGTIAAISPTAGMLYMNLTNFLEGYFVVQATNYTGYAVLYSCNSISDTNLVMAWQYHRKAELSSTEESSITEIVNMNPDLNGTTWKYISHNRTACGGGVSIAASHVLVILATLFVSKEFI